jgi:chromosome segregation ATPase
MRGAVIALTLVLAFAGAAQAQSLEDRLRSQLVAVNGRLQALQNEQATLVAQKTAAEAERDALRRRLAGAEAQARAARRDAAGPELARYKAQADQALQARSEGEASLAVAQAEVSRLALQVQQEQAERRKLAEGLAEAKAAAEVARAKNAEAIAVAREVLDAYAQVGLAEVVGRREPFIGLKRVEIEKIEQAYADRLYGARLDVPPPPPKAQ